MKKIVALLLAAALCLSFAACAAGNVPADAGEPESAPSRPAAPAEPAPVSQPLPAEDPEPETMWTIPEGVTVSLLQETYPVGTEALTLLLDNRSEWEFTYGLQHSFEKFIDGKWEPVPGTQGRDVPAVAFVLSPQSAGTLPLSTGTFNTAQPLDEGLYRITGESLHRAAGGEQSGGSAHEETPPWQIDFRITADAQPEPDYALYISNQSIPTVEGCMVTDRLPVYFINTTGEDGYVLDIPHLERQNDAGEWEAIPWKEGIGFCGTPDPLPAEGRNWSEELSMLWGTLADGRYRLSYEVGPSFDTEETAYGEFTLYTPKNNRGLPLAAGSQTEE